MKRFVEGADRGQSMLLPECLDEWVEESNSVRVIDCFVDSLDLAGLGFEGVEPAATGRPAYHPSVLLNFIFTGISTGSSRAGGLNARPAATWKSYGCSDRSFPMTR
jgi:transposase